MSKDYQWCFENSEEAADQLKPLCAAPPDVTALVEALELAAPLLKSARKRGWPDAQEAEEKVDEALAVYRQDGGYDNS